MNTPITPNETPTPRMTAEHWARLHAMTEEQIKRNALDDPDNPPLDTYVAEKDGAQTIHITIDPLSARWLQEHRLDGGKIAASLLHQFVEAQLGNKSA